MLITRHFVFVHFQKTGGVFIKNLCQAHTNWVISNDEEHPPASAIPSQFRHLPVLGFVRNPWDWYVSWYHYVGRQGERLKDSPDHSPWVAIFRQGQASFPEVIRAACGGVPSNGNSPSWMDEIRQTQVDLYSRWCDQMFRVGFDGDVELGRFEHLRSDFLSFLHRHDVSLPDGFEHAALTRPPDNRSDHAPYRSYYDHDLRELVGRTNRLVSEYGYEF